ncbi:cysteine desulfurase family protein [Synechococcus elongatus]|uniref:cysteine desulfurase family protein n=1 Tax=Synechococcus elongatus TaxID=32046 RepID=UPI000F7D6C1F|nr:cysteine desulfurase family protein [Synechococcus elongatus]
MSTYLDYSATTPMRPEVLERFTAVAQEQWGNAASLHQWGNRAALVLERSRQQVAALIQAEPEAIAFSSGGTESDNWAILSPYLADPRPGHLIISAVEHSAIARPAAWLEQRGWQVTRLPVDRSGRIQPADLASAVRPDTRLISVIWGQSEVGTIQPIAELAAIAREHGILFHTDAVQVAGRLPIDVQRLPIDLLSLSSHKLYGPQGVGALYIRPGVELAPLLQGGNQESGLRSGTPPIAAIAAFGEAAQLAAAELPHETARLQSLRDRLIAVLATEPRLRLTGDPMQRLPHHASFIARGGTTGTSQQLVRAMNRLGFGISGGSACNSGRSQPSPVLLAMGYSPQEALAGIRFSLGRSTQLAEVEAAAIALRSALHSLPQASLLSPA